MVGVHALPALELRVGDLVGRDAEGDVHAGVGHGLRLDLQHALQQGRVLPLDFPLHDWVMGGVHL